MATLSVRLLGPFQVTLDGEAVTGFATDKVRALLAFLVVEADRPHRRESLAGLLWPDYPERSARTSLRSALANLRQVIGDAAASPPYLDISRQTIQLNPEREAWSDVAVFVERLESAGAPGAPGEGQKIGLLEEAVDLYRGPFLEGFSLADSPAFEEWALLTREGFQRQASTALRACADHHEKKGDFQRALAYARRQVDLDPWQEAAQHQLMRLLALNDQRSAALARYEGYRQLLATELGLEPAEEIKETFERLSRGELPTGPHPAKGALDREPRVVGACPYRGLAAFREADAPFFFGREDFTERLFQAVHERPLVAVIVGSSGSGKSSAVYAGLLPRLRETDGDVWLNTDFRPGSEPFHALAAALLSLLEPELGETDRLIETQKLAEALRERGIDLYAVIERAVEKAVGSTGVGPTGAGAGRLLLLVDQFEELYTLCPDPDTRRHFLDTLLAAVEAGSTRRASPLALLLTLRADFMGQALAHRPFADALQGGSLMLGPMTQKELKAAIEKPAERQGATLEAGLAERLLDDVGEEPGNLPLLEFALTLLWGRLDDGWMTHAAYEDIGRVDGALARYAEQVYDELEVDEQEAARRVFLQLVQPGEGTEDTRRVATRAELGEENWPLAQHLADKRLVVTGRDIAGRETAEVVHEALIQRWRRLRGWMEADRAFRTWQERLRAALRAWEASDRDEGGLLRGAPLVEAEGWWAEREKELSAAEEGFIQAGVALRERRQLERERRRRRTILALVGGLVVALLLVLLTGQQWLRAEEEVDARATAEAVAVQERQAAQTEAGSRATAEAVALEQREEALRQASIGLAAKALAELEGTAPERAVLLALEALEGYPYTPQAESALAQAVEAHVPTLVFRGLPYTWGVAWSPDGERIAAGSDSGLILWGVDSDARWRRFRLAVTSGCFGHDVAWSPSGDRLVAVGTKLTEDVGKDCVSPRVWELYGDGVGELRSTAFVFTGHEGQTNSVDWSPDGATILSGGVDGSAKIWDADSGEERLTLSGHTGSVNDAVWSPGGERVVTVGADGTAKVWDVTAALKRGGGEALTLEPLTLSGHMGGVNAAAWSPDGGRVATAGADGLVQVWLLPGASRAPGDAPMGEILFTLSGHSKEVRGVAWSPDGERIATSSADGSVRLWDAATGEKLVTLHGLSDDLRNVAWSRSGDRLVVGGGKNVPVWDVSRRPLRLSGHSDDVWDAQWSPDGRTIGTSSYDGTARIWDAATGEELLAMEHPSGVRFFAWSPDGRRIVTTCQDGVARVWDTGSGELLLEVSAPRGHLIYVASWSPDGSRFAASEVFAGAVSIYDAATGDPISSFAAVNAHRATWAPEGDRIVIGSNSGSAIRDASTGKRLKYLGRGSVINAAWSPDGGRIVLGQADGKTRVFDATSGEELTVFAAHSDAIWHATWSPNGKRIVSSDVSGEVRVWDAASGAEVLSFRAPAAIYSVNWSPDGQYVIAAGYFNPPVIRRAWQSTEDLIAHARECCVTRELTPEERELFGLPKH